MSFFKEKYIFLFYKWFKWILEHFEDISLIILKIFCIFMSSKGINTILDL